MPVKKLLKKLGIKKTDKHPGLTPAQKRPLADQRRRGVIPDAPNKKRR